MININDISGTVRLSLADYEMMRDREERFNQLLNDRIKKQDEREKRFDEGLIQKDIRDAYSNTTLFISKEEAINELVERKALVYTRTILDNELKKLTQQFWKDFANQSILGFLKWRKLNR